MLIETQNVTIPKKKVSVENVTSISSNFSLEERNEQRWKELENRYRFVNLSLLTNPSLLEGKTITYECISICGGLGDRLRGIIMSYFLSLLLKRQLIIDMERPCPFTNYFQPNKYRWIRANDYVEKGSVHRIRSIDQNLQLANQLKTAPFIDTWSNYDHIQLRINIDFLEEIFSNPHLRSDPIIKMFLNEMSVGEANYQTLFGLFYEILFKPTKKIVHIIDHLLINRSIEDLICTHLRIGENPSNPRDHPFEYRHQITNTIIQYLSKYEFLEKNCQSSLFISSDSLNSTNEILEAFPGKSFSISGPILQIDLPTDVHCDDGFTKVVADFNLLSECSTVILTNSGFSAYANRRRFNPYQNLYKFNQKQNRVDKCLDLRSPKGWEPSHSIKIKLFCPIQTDNYTLEDIL